MCFTGGLLVSGTNSKTNSGYDPKRPWLCTESHDTTVGPTEPSQSERENLYPWRWESYEEPPTPCSDCNSASVTHCSCCDSTSASGVTGERSAESTVQRKKKKHKKHKHCVIL